MNKNILTLFVLDDNEKKELLEKYLPPHDKTVSEVKKNNIINSEPEIPPEDKAENIPDIDILPDKKVSAKEKDTVKKTNGKKFAVIASVFAAVIVAFTSFCIISSAVKKDTLKTSVSDINETTVIISDKNDIQKDKTTSVSSVSVTESKPSASSVPATESKPSVSSVPVTESKPSVSSVPVTESKPSVSSVPATESKPSASSVPPAASTPAVVVSDTDVPEKRSELGFQGANDDDHDNSLSSIRVIHPPEKTQYLKGESLDMTGLKIEASYNDGSINTIESNKCTFSGFDSSSKGIKTINISYEGKTTTIKVEVIEDVSEGNTITGKCGNLLTYKLDAAGTLTISGSGDMDEAAFESDGSIKKVIIESGAKSVGGYAFSKCTSLVSAEMPDSITHIKYCSFADCISLKTITVPKGVKSIEDNAFGGCTALEKIVIPENVSDIDDTAFDGCEKLTIQCKKRSYADEFAKKNGIKTAYM